MSSDQPGRQLSTLTTAFEILELVKTEGTASFTDIMAEFDMAKSTAHGYLRTLMDEELLVKQDQKYRLGFRVLHMGMHARNRNENYALTEPVVAGLADQLGEGADFMVEECGRLITLYNEVHSRQDPNFKAGRYFYMHNSAGGKAVLAEFPDERVRNIVDQWGLPDETPHTITDTDALFAELETTRERGFGICDEEFREGVRSVGVAVTNPDGTVFGALGVGGPSYRIDDSRLYDQIPQHLTDVAAEFEDEIAKTSD